jgi:predicted small secreted protein
MEEGLKKSSLLVSVGLAAMVALLAACNTGTTGAQIALYDVTSGTTAVNPGSTVDFGTAYVSGPPRPVTRNFRLDNNGDAPFTLAGAGTIVISGADPGNFSIPTEPPASVPAGGSVDFNVLFSATTTGSPVQRKAMISISSNLASISVNVTGNDQYS